MIFLFTYISTAYKYKIVISDVFGVVMYILTCVPALYYRQLIISDYAIISTNLF